MPEISLEYLAGFFDADGSVGIYRSESNRKYVSYRVGVTIAQLDPAVLRFVKEKYGGSLRFVDYSKAKKKRRDIWTYNSGSHAALRLLKDLYPHLIGKKEQVRLAIEFMGLRAKPGERYSQTGKIDPGPEYAKRAKDLKWKEPEEALH